MTLTPRICFPSMSLNNESPITRVPLRGCDWLTLSRRGDTTGDDGVDGVEDGDVKDDDDDVVDEAGDAGRRMSDDSCDNSGIFTSSSATCARSC